jgi:hypothetical protein
MFNRVMQRSTKASKTSGTAMFPSPTPGYVKAQIISKPKPGTLALADNWFPTLQGARVRKGREQHATIDAAATHLTVYDDGGNEKMFACDADSIYDISTPASPTVAPTADITGLSGGDWSSIQFRAGGGNYLVMVNGENELRQYNGTDWATVNDATSVIAFDAEAGAFTAGLTVTGGTSGATAVIVDVLASSLRVKTVTGTFQDNENITDSSTGDATTNIPSGIETAISITGVNTEDLTHVWKHKSRLWFIEKNSMSAWYLPPLSVGGTANELQMGGLFALGGELLFGATWSLDAGDGLDDVCVFVTNKGEVAVYQGTDPSSASTWALSGVYRIGVPLHKNAHFRAGGEILVVTDQGIVPISAAVNKDRAGLGAVAITAPIEDVWRAYVKQRQNGTGRFNVVLWHEEQMLLVGMPKTSTESIRALAANALSGAWSSGFTNWDVQCSVVFNNDLFFGDSSGAIWQGETGGSDDGDPYTATAVYSHVTMNEPGFKTACHARATIKTNYNFQYQLFAVDEYEIETPTPLDASTIGAPNVWGSGVWGTMVWGTESALAEVSSTQWQTVRASGVSISPGISITVGGVTVPDIELVEIQLQYEVGEVMG